MSDTEKRWDVLATFLHRPDVFSAMADRIVELETAVERVRALHGRFDWCTSCGCHVPCSTLRALEGTP